MEDNNIQKIFTSLKHITPDSAYVARSKATIFMSAQDEVRPRSTIFSFRERFTFIPAVALGGLLLIIVVGGAFLSSPTGDVVNAPAISNTAVLTKEASEADFSLRIAEADYFDQSAAEVALALDEIAEEDANSDELQ